MNIAISRSRLALVSAILIFLLLHSFGVKALQSTPSPIVGFSISPTNPHYATVQENGLLEIIDYQSSTLIGTYFIPLLFQDIANLRLDGYTPRAIAYSPDGRQIAVSVSEISASGVIYLLDWETGEITEAYNQTYLRRINDMSWSFDGSKLVLALQDGGADQLILSSVEILNVVSGELEQVLIDRSFIDNYAFTVVDWSSSNIIAYAHQSMLLLWDADINTEIESFDTSAEILDAAWAQDGNRIATLHKDRTLQIWDVNSDLLAPLQTMSIAADNFRSRDMRWLDDNLLAVNIWTEIQIWNVVSGVLEEVIETDNFVLGLGALANNEIAFAGPQSVSTYSLVDLRTPTPSPVMTATSTFTMTPTASATYTSTFTPTPTPTFTSTPLPSSTTTFTPTPTDTPSPTPAVTCTSSAANPSALVSAITAANANGASADTICLTANSTYSFFSASNSIALPSITTPITIVGNGAILERGSGAPQFRLFNVTASGSLTLQNMNVRNFHAGGGNGGAILSTGTVTLDGVTPTNRRVGSAFPVSKSYRHAALAPT